MSKAKEASVKALKRVREDLAYAENKLGPWKEAVKNLKEWKVKMNEENEKLKEKVKDQSGELKQAHEQRRSHRADLEKCQRQLKEAQAEIEELKIQAGVKRSKPIADQEEGRDEAFLLHIESLSEALNKRDSLIKDMVQRPHHPDTKTQFEEVKRCSEKLKDLELYNP